MVPGHGKPDKWRVHEATSHVPGCSIRPGVRGRAARLRLSCITGRKENAMTQSPLCACHVTSGPSILAMSRKKKVACWEGKYGMAHHGKTHRMNTSKIPWNKTHVARWLQGRVAATVTKTFVCNWSWLHEGSDMKCQLASFCGRRKPLEDRSSWPLYFGPGNCVASVKYRDGSGNEKPTSSRDDVHGDRRRAKWTRT